MSGIPEALRLRFVERCRRDLAGLEAGVGDADLRIVAHGIAGTGGTFGHPEISAAAGRVEDALLADGRPTEEELEALKAALRRAITSGG